MYDMPDSTASYAAPETAQYDFSHGLVDFWIVRAIAQNLAEIGIVGDEVQPAKELQTFPFAEDRLVLIAPRGHVVSHQRTIAFRETLGYDYIGLAAGHALQEQMEDHAGRGKSLRRLFMV
jgi:DNA-binding transcriptional LysR family regulator